MKELFIQALKCMFKTQYTACRSSNTNDLDTIPLMAADICTAAVLNHVSFVRIMNQTTNAIE